MISPSCRAAATKANLGRVRSLEVRKKISDFWKGRPRTVKHQERLRQSFIESWVRRLEGKERAPDRHDSPAYISWREAVRVRDDYTCQRCKKRGGKIHSHHLKSWANFPELRFETSNGIAVCPPCHKILNREQRRLERGDDIG